eukprot:15079180-Heterocapsa_arctica.AAC.1
MAAAAHAALLPLLDSRCVGGHLGFVRQHYCGWARLRVCLLRLHRHPRPWPLRAAVQRGRR